MNSWIEAPSTVWLIFYEVMEKDTRGEHTSVRSFHFSEVYNTNELNPIETAEACRPGLLPLELNRTKGGLWIEAWIQDETARPKLLQLAQYLGNSKIQEKIVLF